MLIPPYAALVLATALAASRPVPIPPEGGRETFSLESMQWRSHEIALEAGQFVQATVEQRGLDVKVRTVGPDGHVLDDEIDSSEGPTGLEPVSLLATRAGVHRIDVWAPDDVQAAGRYDLETSAPRVPDARDRVRLAAESLMVAGGRVMGPRATGVRRPRATREQSAEAIETYGTAARLWASLDETCWRAEATTCRAIHHHWKNHLDESTELLHEATELWQSCGDEHKLAETVLYIGRSLVLLSRYRDAADMYQHGLELAEGRFDVLELQFLVQLASTYGQIGDTAQAVRYGERALPILRERGYYQGQAMTLSHLARAHYRRGDLERSIEMLLEALPLHRLHLELAGEIETLALLGDAWEALGEPEIAIGYLQEAVDVHIEFLQMVHVRSRLASLLDRAGRRARALEQLERAIETARVFDSVGGEAQVRLQRARLRIDARDWDGAAEDAEAALEASDRSGDRVALSEALQLAAIVRQHEGDLGTASAALDESLALRRSVGDRVGEAVVLRDQAGLSVAKGALDDARRLLEDARAIVEERRGLLATPQLRATWSSTVRDIDESYVDVLMALHRQLPGDGWDARAFEASEGAAARSLLDEVGGDPVAPGAVSPELTARERSARERLTQALDRQIRARASGEPPSTLDRLADEVRELSMERNRALAALGAAAPRRVDLARPPTLRLADLQAGALDDETTLIEFFLGRERGYAWVVRRDRLDTYDLPARARVAAAVDAVHRALAMPPKSARSDPAAAALRALGDLVLPPARIPLRGRRLVVVADLPLHHVPFAALPDASGKPLVARYEITNAPSASVADVLRRRSQERAPAPRALAVIADPVYDGDDERLPGVTHPPADAAVQRATRDFGFVDGRLPRLPFTRREALAIAALAPARETSLSLDFRANLDTALSPQLESYRYVHFAAHGLLNDVRPELSGLVLSLVDARGRPRPGLLTAPDVSSLRLGADLVVLSSCRSAAGREVRGEGLVGLTRAFMSAGAPRVVASLWPVDDVSSSELMARMYRRMLGPAHASPAAALRDAQLATRRDQRFRAPYYWAGFQLQGDWR